MDPDLPVGDAAQAVADGRRAVVVERVAVGDDADVGLQQVGVLVDERLDRLRADLLVALEEEAQVDRQPPGGLHPGLDRLEVHEQLALVVAGAARVDALVLVARLERRSDPLVERVGRLDVVVAVDEHGRRVRPRHCSHSAVTIGWCARLVHRGALDADARQLVGDPLRRAPHLAGALRVGADTLSMRRNSSSWARCSASCSRR